MNRILSFLLFVLPSFILFGQVPTIQIKVKEKSGFLGLGGPRFMEVRLSNRTGTLPLTDQNVNSDTQYVFLCKPAGDWQFDEDFVDEDLGRLSLHQDERVFPMTWKGPFGKGDTLVAVGFSRLIRLNAPLLFRFAFNATADSAEVAVPMDLWPGFSAFRELMGKLNGAVMNQRYRESIAFCEDILRGEAMFNIFPTFAGLRKNRTEIFEQYYLVHKNRVEGAASNTQADLKSRIAILDEERPIFVFVRDSLPRSSLGIPAEDSAIADLAGRSVQTLGWLRTTRDSLQRALDDQNVRWILEGSVAGRTGFKYQTVLEALAYSYSSLDFADTAATELTGTISEEQRAILGKENLMDSYETFVRLANERYRQGMPPFAPEFLLNVQKDVAVFRLPFYSMLAAVNDYYTGNLDQAQDHAFKIFRVCYDPQISERFDRMRIMIKVRQGLFSAEAVELVDEAESMEKIDVEAAGDLYRRAVTIAPNFAYASFALGRYYTRQGDPIRAQPFFVRAYETDSLYLSAYRESANLYRRSGNYKPMIEVLALAIYKGNDYWETQSNLGLAYMGDGDPARAIQHYERALAINPQSYTTNIQLGLAYQTVKNYQKAREYFNNAINIDPLRQEAVEYLTRLNELQRSGK
ncbi:MAG: tetratricopeptide repeat protein [Ignavibacteriales bacterium]|nr:tetratricopeptide repeat protein [Ignavibacteriales bacterium]